MGALHATVNHFSEIVVFRTILLTSCLFVCPLLFGCGASTGTTVLPMGEDTTKSVIVDPNAPKSTTSSGANPDNDPAAHGQPN
jgi:hypothetical protein